MSDFNQQIIEEFRANRGIVGGPFEGAPLLLLNHTGARTGATRTTPLVYFEENGNYAIFASKAGAPSNPDWYYNLKAHPEVTVEIGTEEFNAVGTEILGSERDRIFAANAELRPNFSQYVAATTRLIPVVVLTRLA